MDEQTIVLSQHAIDMARSRLNFNEKTLERMANKAYHHGLPSENLPKQLQGFIASKYRLHSDTANTFLKIYGEVVYIFAKVTGAILLVTLYQLPGKLRRKSIVTK